MTPTDAAALAILGASHRRWLAALLQILNGDASAEARDSVPSREPGESVVAWACRIAPAQGDRAPQPTAIVAQASRQLAEAARGGVTPLAIGDAAYPQLLAAIHDPPPVLWVRGCVEPLALPAIAIVGSRAATPYALAMARRLSHDLAAAGVAIVSGLARGVDSAAHAGALDAKGKTVGVLGCGIDRVYPAEHRDLARDIAHAGAVVSEFPAGVPPLPHHFPLRNRIIAALARAIVVVEAPEKSGSLITAAAALEQGKEVMVVPGPATGGRNRGGHLLIRDGARIVESADDVLQELGCAAGVAAAPPVHELLGQLPEANDFSIDDVTAHTGEEAATALARLLELELTGQIQRIGGGRFIRVLT